MTPEIMIMGLKEFLNTCYVLGTWTCTNSFNPCQPCEKNGLTATSCLLTRKLRHGEIERLLQCHPVSSGSEPRSPVPKLFSFHDLCSCCLRAVFPICQLQPLPQGALRGGAWGQWSPFSGPMRPTWFGPLSTLWPPLPWPSALSPCPRYRLPCFSMIS